MITKNQIKFIKSLSAKQVRNESQMFVAEGDKLIEELVNSDILTIEAVYKTTQSKLKTQAQIIEPELLARMSQLKSPPESLAIVQIPRIENTDAPQDKLSLVLDEVQDPGNLGTIIRIADWYGIENIFCSPNSADCYNPKVIQSTMGAIGRVKVHYTDIAELLRKYSGKIWGTMLSEKATILYNTTERLNEGLLVMGNEGRGISAEVAKMLTQEIYIPNYGSNEHVESLNVAVATAITVAEIRRRG